jgi:hypothetical protein
MNVDFVRKDEPEAVKKDEYIPTPKSEDLPF